MIHEMHLHNEPFNNIKNGHKTIEVRINDEKRKKIKIGDKIIFTNRLNNEKLKAVIINLTYFKNFKEVYENLDPFSIDFLDGEEAYIKEMEKYYSKEEQEKYGIVAISIKKEIE